MDPIEENEGLKPQGTQLNVDSQTNVDSSDFKAKLQGEIQDGDAKLGGEIKKVSDTLKDKIEDNSDNIASIEGTVSEVKKDLTKNITDVAEDLLFLTGDKDSEYTAKEVKAKLEEYLTEQKEAIEIIKQGVENVPAGQYAYATLWLENFGEVYSALHFAAWNMKDFSTVTDDLDSSQMDQYNRYVEKLREQLVDLYANLETATDPSEVEDIQNEIDGIVKAFERITDRDELNPDDITKNQATLEKGIQYFFDIDTNAFEEFVENLNTNVLGQAGGEYYRELRSDFKQAAAEAKVHIDMGEAAENDGVELSDEERFNFEKSRWFESTFTLVPTIVAVFSYDDWRDRLNQVDFNEDVYRKYIDFVTNRLDEKVNLEALLENATDPSEVEDLQKRLSILGDELSKYTCATNMEEFNPCQAGHFAWYLNNHATDENSFRTILAERALGIGIDGSTEGTGEYYRELKSSFEQAAAEAKVYIDMGEAAENDGVELSDSEMYDVEKSRWFEATFTLVSTLAAVLSFEDWRDRLKEVDFNEDVYAKYISFVTSSLDEKANLEAQLENATDPSEVEDLQKRLTILTEELSNYTCATDMEEFNPCQAGHFAWYLNKHDRDENAHRAFIKEEIGLDPVVSVVDLDVNKAMFKAVTDEAIVILKAEPGAHPISVIESAQAHIDRFGRNSESTTAYAEWQNYVLETNVGSAIGELLSATDCVTEKLVEAINDNVENTSIKEAILFPLPDGEEETFKILVEGDFKVVIVTVNGLVQRGYSVSGNEIEFPFAPAKSSQVNVLVESTDSPEITVPTVDSCEISIVDPLKTGTYTCSEISREIARLRRVLDQLMSSKNQFSDINADKQQFVTDIMEAIAAYSKQIEDANKAMEQAGSELKKISEELSASLKERDSITKSLDESNSQKSKLERNISDNETTMSELESTIKISQMMLDAENARPYPSAEVVTGLQESIAASKEQSQAIETQIVDDKASLEKVKDEIATAESSLDGVSSDIQEHESMQIEKGAILSDAKANIAMAEDQTDFAQSQSAESLKTIKENEEAIETINVDSKVIAESLKGYEMLQYESCDAVAKAMLRSASATSGEDLLNSMEMRNAAGEGEPARMVIETGYFGNGAAAITGGPWKDGEVPLEEEKDPGGPSNEEGTGDLLP